MTRSGLLSEFECDHMIPLGSGAGTHCTNTTDFAIHIDDYTGLLTLSCCDCDLVVAWFKRVKEPEDRMEEAQIVLGDAVRVYATMVIKDLSSPPVTITESSLCPMHKATIDLETVGYVRVRDDVGRTRQYQPRFVHAIRILYPDAGMFLGPRYLVFKTGETEGIVLAPLIVPERVEVET